MSCEKVNMVDCVTAVKTSLGSSFFEEKGIDGEISNIRRRKGENDFEDTIQCWGHVVEVRWQVGKDFQN